MESQYHEKEWTVEEDALAFLTDAGLVWLLTMSQQGRWPTYITISMSNFAPNFHID